MSDCPCKADEIMAKAKDIDTEYVEEVKGDIVTNLRGVLKQMASKATPDNDKHRACILKLDATIKFIKARW